MNIRTTRRHLVTASAGTAALAVSGIGLAQEATPRVDGAPASGTPAAEPVSAGWPRYGNTLNGDRASSASGISLSNAVHLQPLWQIDVDGPVSATPVIANGVAYAGSYDGNLYAVDLATGAEVWTYATGAAVPEPNLGIPLGITGSATVERSIVYVGDAAANVHAIDAGAGEAIWTSLVDDQTHASIWSSPVVWNGLLYVGVASISKEPGFRGSVVALDAATGEVVWQRFMVPEGPEGADGAGVFAVPAIDMERGALYVGTQNAYTANPAPYGNPISIVALDAATGEERWVVNAPVGDGSTAPTDDVGFSASPNLFTVEIDGASRDLVGNGQKSGDFWALDRDTGEIVWQAVVSPAGFLGGMEGTSGVANNVVVVPATDWPEFDGPAKGMVSAFDAATGLRRWTNEQEGGPAACPVAIADDVVFQAGMDGILHAYALSSGNEVWSYDLGSSVSGGIGIADGVLVLGAATPEFAPFVRPGSTIQAFGIVNEAQEPAATPIAATPQG